MCQTSSAAASFVEARDERRVDAVGEAVGGGQDQVPGRRVQHRGAAGVQRSAAEEYRADGRVGLRTEAQRGITADRGGGRPLPGSIRRVRRTEDAPSTT